MGDAKRRFRPDRLPTGLAALVLAIGFLTGCGIDFDNPSPVATTPTPTGTVGTSPDQAASATPGPSASIATPGPGNPTPSTTGSTGPVSASPLSCTSVLPRRLGKVTIAPARTTDVVTVVSDGRTLTSGTSQQTAFAEPRLTGPDGAVITDTDSIESTVDLVETGRTNVLTTRPEAPDSRADVSRRPFDAPGTYALYNASGLMTAQVVVLCSGQQQTWQFEAEANPVSGTVNCAVEPARSNALARSVYQTSC